MLFAGVVLGLTFLAARVWWLTHVVPGMDYPQFLVFVRAVRDMGDPSSPFHGTYTTGPWFVPTSLPVHFTSLLSRLFPGPHAIESAGKLLLTLQNVGLVGAMVYLLRALDRPRWGIVLVFPIVHSIWTVVCGFAAFATSLPLVVLTWGLTVTWLRRLDVRSGALLAATLCVVLLWHGLGYSQAGLGFAVLWALWRAPSWRARLRSVAPTVPSLLQYAIWMRTTFSEPRGQSNWTPPWDSVDQILHLVWYWTPHRTGVSLVFCFLVGLSMAVNHRNQGIRRASRVWRVDNPMLLLSLVY
ncbi:MAG: hypothetical protein ACREOE_17345, partial [Gemmatimonadales bacterium]